MRERERERERVKDGDRARERERESESERSKQTWCLTSTETIRLIRDGERERALLYIVSTTGTTSRKNRKETVYNIRQTERRTQYTGEQNCSPILTTALSHSGLEHNESAPEYDA